MILKMQPIKLKTKRLKILTISARNKKMKKSISKNNFKGYVKNPPSKKIKLMLK
jgi:hypothetical protein